MKIMIAVTHLLGTGHLARALVLARAFSDAGHTVTVASGGMPAPHLDASGLRMTQLPPVRSDGVNFTRLLGPDGPPVDASYMETRVETLRATLCDFAPDVLITELFPFGRRVLRTEFTALLEAASKALPRPLVCASVRDILAPPSKPAKAQMARETIANFYDAVLVHSDPDVITLDQSWPVTPEIEAKLHYTGFVAPAPANDTNPTGIGREVLVTAGGGNVGVHLFETALKAAAQRPDLAWRLLVGGTEAARQIAGLKALAPPNAHIGPTTPAFRQMLRQATASVSFCGYNTALDVLQCGVRAIFVPFDAGGETEQTMRARALTNLDGIDVVTSDRLSPETLVAALTRVASAPARTAAPGMDGAERTVRLVTDLRAAQTG